MDTLTTIASEFEFPLGGGLFVMLVLPGTDPNNVISGNALLTDSAENLDYCIKKVYQVKSGGRIIFHNIKPNVYKNSQFRNLCRTCKNKNIQIIIITCNLLDIPANLRAKIDYWFMHNIDDNYLGFTPLNNLAGWDPLQHNSDTFIVAQFTGDIPEIWWWNPTKDNLCVDSNPPVQSVEDRIEQLEERLERLEAKFRLV